MKLPDVLDRYDASNERETRRIISDALDGVTDANAVQSPRSLVSPTTHLLNNAFFNVKDYRAAGDGVTNDTVAIQAAVTAAIAFGTGGGTVIFPGGRDYRITAKITVTGACTLRALDGKARIVMDTVDTPAFEVSASNVKLWGLAIRGKQSSTFTSNETAIRILGASAAAPVTNVEVRECLLSRWGAYGIYTEWLTDFAFCDNTITDITYAGIMMLSCLRGQVCRNTITDMSPGTASNAYGISVTRRGDQSSLTTYPRSEDIVIAHNVIRDVSIWVGIDTHGGLRLVIDSNVIYNTHIGIHVGCATTTAGAAFFEPLQCVIKGNTLESGVTDGTRLYGIVFVGVLDATAGNSTLCATGCITGNVIKGYGDEDNNTSGAIYCYATRGMAITGNTLREPGGSGIQLYQDNFGFAVTGNVCVDNWSSTTAASPFIFCTIKYNQGVVSGNALVRGSKSATHVCKRGLIVTADTGNLVYVGTNDFSAATELPIDGVRGYIQSGIAKGVSNDRGDANVTITHGAADDTGAEVQRFATALTANRTATLTDALLIGATFKIRRSGGGAFNLIIAEAGGTIATLVQNEWCEVVWAGTEWLVVGRGATV